MHKFNKYVGNFGENLAENYLKKCGYIILDRNFKCKIGEIDIIALDKDYITFIEVKSRYSLYYGHPCECIKYNKIKKIYKTAQFYILKKKLFKNKFRFDVIEIILNKNTDNYSINLIKNAFQIN
ncbi:hypothetical protein CLOACE_00590 [Clostridium acetireducens DSM 10703]|uniref:UPF0102 protein CLOACE_00590 n=1 Tax=Clostridium acetireducens DSM 10703 TaxID=1121290 RepID=A0A1E8F2E1_9CLOT|nr:YraN family protein [Clostridium acetireducens]OFI07711.1 hypothetical protein CLOACE_00590 [Clostridium acetireducens DSM 10703]